MTERWYGGFGVGKPRGQYGTNEGDIWLAPGSPVQERLDKEGKVLVHEMMEKDGEVQECMYVLSESNEETAELLQRAREGHKQYMFERSRAN
jgi:hypothetical protein